MKNAKFLTLGLSVLVALTGCSNVAKNNNTKSVKTEDRYSADVKTGRVENRPSFEGKNTGNNSDENLLNHVVYYFDFDKSDIKGKEFAALEAHARYLSQNPDAHIRIEGHADEQGSREYNVALGERRALAISRMLMLSGADKSQISVVSYGEEKPASRGHDEQAWAKNRRAVIVYEVS